MKDVLDLTASNVAELLDSEAFGDLRGSLAQSGDTR